MSWENPSWIWHRVWSVGFAIRVCLFLSICLGFGFGEFIVDLALGGSLGLRFGCVGEGLSICLGVWFLGLKFECVGESFTDLP